MLTANQLDALTDPILELYERYQATVINDIARRLAKLGKVTSASAWQMQRLIESGALYEFALAKIAKLTGMSEAVLREAFRKGGVQAMRFDDAIYRAVGLNPLPLNLSPVMAEVLAAGLRRTNGQLVNLTRTTALSARQAFERAADLAYMQITSGAFDYDSAIRQAVTELAADGLRVIHYSGKRDLLDVAVRRAALTGVNQTVGDMQIARADEMGCDLVQVSAHVGARPSHAVWQGKIFSRSGTHPKYPDFATSTGYGTGPGLCGWNCRHSFYPFFEGVSEPAYTAAELRDYANRRVTYRGREMTVYEASQLQRGIERSIRRAKRVAGALEAAGLDATAARARVMHRQAQMRAFLRETGLRRQPEREQVYDIIRAKKGIALQKNL